jgi:hypothetical protein
VWELKKEMVQEDITVLIGGGTYTISETVVFDLRDSGSANQKITYKALPGETPVFTSGVKINGRNRMTPADSGYSFLPSNARGHVFVADLPEGWRQVRNLVDLNANWLDRGRIGVTRYIATQHFKYDKWIDGEMWDPPAEKKVQEYSKSMERLSNADDALDLRIWTSDWNMNLLPVASIKGNTLTTTVPGTYRLAIPWNFFGRRKIGHRIVERYEGELCWIENLLEGLDAPGKWVCNTRTNQLYLWPVSYSLDVFAPGLIELVRVEGQIDYWGSTDTTVQYLTFDGITFTNGERAIWQEGDAGIQHDWGMIDKANALLRFRGVENCTVRNCTFRKSGGAGVRFDLHAQRNSVDNCLFEYLGFEAVHFCSYGSGQKDVNKGNRQVNSEVHNVGRIQWDSPAIVVWNNGYNHIACNYVHHCPYNALLLAAPRSWAFNPHYPTREQGWPVARWREIPPEAQVEWVLRNGLRNIPEKADRICAHYRYLRGNLIEGNTLRNISDGLRGDGVFYVSGSASTPNPERDYNRIVSRLFNSTLP